MKIGGAIFGGISASKAAKKAKRKIENEKKENRDWYNARYYADATQRGDAQRMLTKTAEAIKERNRQAAGVQAVTGGSEESVAAAKMANSEALADAASQITANAESRKDAIEQQYRQKDSQLNDKLAQIEQQRSQAITSAIGGVGNAAGGIAESFDGELDGAFNKIFKGGSKGSN